MMDSLSVCHHKLFHRACVFVIHNHLVGAARKTGHVDGVLAFDQTLTKYHSTGSIHDLEVVDAISSHVDEHHIVGRVREGREGGCALSDA